MTSLAAVSLGNSTQTGLTHLIGFLPNILAFLLILVIGYFLAKTVKKVVAKALNAVGLDRRLHESEAGGYVEKVSPANLIGAVVFWLIFLFVLSAAIGALKIPAVTAFMNQVLGYLPNVIAAVLIFVIAAVVAGAIGGAVHKTMGDTTTGKIVRAAVPALVMGIAVFMILNQLRIAPAIVQITYIALIGSVALGAALAFGLGGREVAAQMLSQAYVKGQENRGQVKRDMHVGKERSRQHADTAKQHAQDGNPPTTGAYRDR